MTDAIDLLGKSLLADNVTQRLQINLSNNSCKQRDVSQEVYHTVHCSSCGTDYIALPVFMI